MSFIVKNTSEEYEQPKNNLYNAVCVDLEDLGFVDSTWQGEVKTQHKIRLIFQLDCLNSKNKPFYVSGRYTVSLHAKSGLRKALVAWRGKDFTKEEEQAFDLESLLGKSCKLLIQNVEKDGKTYTNIGNFLPPDKGQASPDVSGYVRKIDRQDYKIPDGVLKMRNSKLVESVQDSESHGEPPAFDTNDDLPF